MSLLLDIWVFLIFMIKEHPGHTCSTFLHMHVNTPWQWNCWREACACMKASYYIVSRRPERPHTLTPEPASWPGPFPPLPLTLGRMIMANSDTGCYSLQLVKKADAAVRRTFSSTLRGVWCPRMYRELVFMDSEKEVNLSTKSALKFFLSI